MNSKTAKKIRKSYKKSIHKIANEDYKGVLLRVARERDIVFIIAICEFIGLIILGWFLWK